MIEYLDIDIYGVTFVFVIDVTIEEWSKFYLKWNYKLSEDDNKRVVDTINDETYNGCCIATDKGDFIIYVRDKNRHGDIAHEIFHACNKVLTNLEFVHEETAEAWAYFIGYVTSKFYDMLDRNKKGSD